MSRKFGRQFLTRKTKWWTRDPVIAGLQRYYADFGMTPTDQGKYAVHQQHTGFDPSGKKSNLGWHQKYPSYASVFNYFGSMREAWRAAGFETDHSFEEWSPMEDWFVLESVGILPRTEVAEILKRSGPAIKRRLYDLGDIRSYNRWGITLTHAATLMGLSQAVMRKYLDYGVIPYMRGVKLYYLNPADLLKVEEFDWTGKVDPELEMLVRNAVAQRICKMLSFGASWRDHEVYKFERTKERFRGRIKNPRTSAFNKDNPKPPNDLEVGDWVRTTGKVRSMQTEVGNRVGVIKELYYSWQRVKRYDGTNRAAWVAMVEFPKIRTITNEKDRRIKYSVPLDFLERTEKPEPEPVPLSMHPEAIRGRQRFAKAVKHARERFTEIRSELT